MSNSFLKKSQHPLKSIKNGDASLLAGAVFYRFWGWPRRVATLDTHNERCEAPRIWGADQLKKANPKDGLESMCCDVAPSYHELVAAGGGASFYAASAG